MSLIVKSSCLILLGFTATLGHADITLKFSSLSNAAPNTIMVRGTMVRTESTPPRGKNISIYDNSTKTLILIDVQQKRYVVMNHTAIEKQVKRIHELRKRVWNETQQQMQKISPEQRKHMEQRMAEIGVSTNKSKQMPFLFSTRRTTRSETVNGIRCEVYESFRNSKKLGEACIAAPEALKISNSDYQTLQGLFAFLRSMTKRFVSGSSGASADMSLFGNVEGLPVKMTSTQGETMTLEEITKQALTSELFVVPSDYKLADLSNIRTMGGGFENSTTKPESGAPVYAPGAAGAYAPPSGDPRGPYGQRGYGSPYPPPASSGYKRY